jgi:hypothetical protein
LNLGLAARCPASAIDRSHLRQSAPFLGAQRLREIADAAPALPGLHAISGIMTAVQIVDPHTRRVLAYVAMSRHSVRPPRQVVNALGEGPERNFTTADDSRLASIGQSILSM